MKDVEVELERTLPWLRTDTDFSIYMATLYIQLLTLSRTPPFQWST